MKRDFRGLLIAWLLIECFIISFLFGGLMGAEEKYSWIRPVVYVTILIHSFVVYWVMRSKKLLKTMAFTFGMIFFMELVWIPRFFWIPPKAIRLKYQEDFSTH